MAIVSREEVNQDSSFAGVDKTEQGVKVVRGFTGSCCDILSRANNPFMTGLAGFEAIGISAEDVEHCLDPVVENPKKKGELMQNPQFKPSLMMKLNPFIAQGIVLLTCDKATLREVYEDTSLDILRKLTFDFMEDECIQDEEGLRARSPVEVAMLIGIVNRQQKGISKASFVMDKDDNSKGAGKPKKNWPRPHGSRPTSRR